MAKLRNVVGEVFGAPGNSEDSNIRLEFCGEFALLDLRAVTLRAAQSRSRGRIPTAGTLLIAALDLSRHPTVPETLRWLLRKTLPNRNPTRSRPDPNLNPLPTQAETLRGILYTMRTQHPKPYPKPYPYPTPNPNPTLP